MLQSLQNLHEWVDSLAMLSCKEDPIVSYDDKTRAHGFFHRMRQVEHTRFLINLNRLAVWLMQCQAANISCGKLLSIVPGERGSLTILHIPNVGPYCVVLIV